MKEDEIVEASKAKVLKSEITGNFNISTDTRTIKDGDLYLPLKGANFDGEKFIAQALEKGAVGYFTTTETIFDSAKLVFKVDDTLKTYLQLANFYKNKINPKTVMITGSSGKTTTKEMVYAVLKEKFKAVKTFSNHNNEIGFCQTVFEITSETEVLIIEAGMRGLGEIELISKYAQPDIAIITNIGTAHIGRLGSRENIAKAKCEIAKYLKNDGVLIALNQEITKNTVQFGGEKVFYSLKDVKILDKKQSYTRFEYRGLEYELNVDGDYNVENSLSAIETGFKLNMTYDEIRRGLFSYKPIEKRWETEKIGNFTLINDSYNANPESMKASVKTFAELYKNPIVVLGNMGELGENEIELHREVGKYFSDMKNVKFLTVGNLAREIAEVLENNDVFAKSFDTNEEVSRYILDMQNIDCTIFLKASRIMKFEEIIENLKRGSL